MSGDATESKFASMAADALRGALFCRGRDFKKHLETQEFAGGLRNIQRGKIFRHCSAALSNLRLSLKAVCTARVLSSEYLAGASRQPATREILA